MMILSILLFLAISAEPVYAGLQQGSLCEKEEDVVFSCHLQKGGRALSICSPRARPTTSISFRYGTSQNIEITYVSTPTSDKRFFANVLPANPRASVKQMWFDLNGVRYMVTECIGRRCQHSGGIIIYRGDEVIAAEACIAGENSSFNPAYIDFGSDIAGSKSNTGLIQLQDVINEVEALYPPQLTD